MGDNVLGGDVRELREPRRIDAIG